ncbi:MAG: leukotriene A4 hydrolase C-terminal domain-containing protein [Melioribacteraceae bacterium]|nr:leukotriene A4 hydrolase C-terminal domain-containing protein [Melioribacteraceae bacterium]
MTSQNFVEYAKDKLVDGNSDIEELLRIDQWVFQPGLPNNHVVPHSNEFDKVDEAAAVWLNGYPAEELNTENWTTHHYLHFIRELPWTMSQSQLKELDKTFSFTATQNSEILHAWLLRAIHNNYKPAYDELEDFLLGMGRRKFLRPLYSKLVRIRRWERICNEIVREGTSALSSDLTSDD